MTVIDLRYKLGLDAAKVLPESRILIVNSDDELVGLLVEAVKDTIFLHPNEMSEAPPQVHGIDSTAVRGIYQTDGHLLALLDHDAILKTNASGLAAMSMRVLVADDSALFRRVISETLRSMPEVEIVGSVSTGVAAVQKARELHPDLIQARDGNVRCLAAYGCEIQTVEHQRDPGERLNFARRRVDSSSVS